MKINNLEQPKFTLMLKEFIVFGVILLFIMPYTHAQGQESSRMTKWFQHKSHKSLVISKSILGNKKPLVILNEINNIEYIERLIKIISDLPTDRDEMMKSFFEAEEWTLRFCNKNEQCDSVKFYDGNIKTPNTGFYAEHPKEETHLSQEIRNLISPKYNVPIPAIVGYAIPFKDFDVIYLGTTDHHLYPTDLFKIIPKKGPDIKLEISSGQSQHPPLKFIVGKTLYTIVRDTLDSGFKLYPYYFSITK